MPTLAEQKAQLQILFDQARQVKISNKELWKPIIEEMRENQVNGNIAIDPATGNIMGE